MSEIFTIDASVFVSAYNDYEVGHEESHRLLELLRERGLPLLEPMLLLPEIAAAISRVYKNVDLALAVAANLKALPHMSLIPMTDSLVDLAVLTAAHQRLRGSDAVYAAVARRYNTTLVTLDQEQYARVGNVVTTQTPGEAVAALTTPESPDQPDHEA